MTTTRKHQLYFDHYDDSLNKTLCINISILDDNIEEDIQNFTVVLSTNNNLVRLGDPSVVHVIVQDNDCKFRSVDTILKVGGRLYCLGSTMILSEQLMIRHFY